MKTEEMHRKIEELIHALSLEEKVAMIHGNGLFCTGEVERLGIPALKLSDGPMGIRQEFPRDSWVPVGNSDDFVSYCPSNSAIAATWNKEIAYSAGKILGEEARGRGKDVILGPGINILRTPANGRNFEYMSEDPYLISELVVPMIEGIQKSDVAACVKHFALNSQETERVWVNVEIDERALREIYLPGFEAAVKQGNSYSLMGAYNLFRGVHCCENKELLGDILRKEWGYDGMIVSDWGAAHDTQAAAEGPLDLEMSVTCDFDQYHLAQPLINAVHDGIIKETDIDEKVRHILLLMFRLKMLDAAENFKRKAGCYNTAKHHEMIRKAVEESIVLLKNEENVLPFDAQKIKKLLVIGDNAERLHSCGGGSAEIKALYEISPLLGIKELLGGNTQVTYARGYYVSPKEETEINWQENSIDENFHVDKHMNERGTFSEKVLAEQKKLRDEAVALAAQYDHVIVVGGLNHDYDVEGFDRSDITLPYNQDQLIEEVLAVNPNAVVVMMTGNAIAMDHWKDQAKAIIWNSYIGMEGGRALADVLFGNVNPSGKLPESMPYSMEDCGAHALGEYPGRPLTEKEKTTMNAHTTMTYKDGIYVGYRYYEKYQVPVQYCFGHGLSYTTFQYSDISVDKTDIVSDDLDSIASIVHVTVTNEGNRAGKEIIEVYVGKKDSAIDRPMKELRGFQKISLAPGESQTVEIPLTRKAFTYYDTAKKTFVVEPGEYQVYVGKSLEDIQSVLSIFF